LIQYFGPDYELDVRPSNMENANSPEYLQKILSQVIDNLRNTQFAPSVQKTEIPPPLDGMDDEADAELDDLDEDENKDVRWTERRWDQNVEKDGELSESDDDEEAGNAGVRKNGRPRRRNIMDFQNANAVADDEMDSGTASPQNVNGSEKDVTSVPKTAEAELGGELGANAAAISSGVPSRRSTPAVAKVDEDGDIDMGDSSAVVADPSSAIEEQPATSRTTVATPPLSPTPNEGTKQADGQAASATITTEATNKATEPKDEEMIDEVVEKVAVVKEEGVAERETADIAAEAATEKDMD
jgi:histone deacetylase 1/2